MADDNYDDEEFDDYDEEFEAEEPEPAPVVVQPARPQTASQRNSNLKVAGTVTATRSIQSAAKDENALSTREVEKLKKAVEAENSDALERHRMTAKQSKPETKRSNFVAPPKSADIRPARPTPEFHADPIADAKPSQRKTRKFSSVAMPSAGAGMDPRGRRIAKLRASGVLDLQEEKATQLNIAPTTKYDLYHRMLRANDATIKQMGVPLDEETREMETNTEEILTADKEVQFSYGDDTALLNIITAIDKRRKSKGRNLIAGSGSSEAKSESKSEAKSEAKSEKKKSRSSTSTSTSTQSTLLEEAGIDVSVAKMGALNQNQGKAANKLAEFLQRSGLLCETLLEEERQQREEKSANRNERTQNDLFDPSAKAMVLGQGAKGANELIRNRAVVSARFSSLQPYLLLTAHPYREDDADDLRPMKGLYCIWDLLSPASPSIVLETTGQPTCGTFSATQTYVVAGGTADGGLCLWDLREATAIHRDRDAIDLGIERGIRKCCYRTHLMIGIDSDFDTEQHTSAVAQVEPIGHNNDIDPDAVGAGNYSFSTPVSQFVSLDVSGTAILWMTTETNVDNGLDFDVPGGVAGGSKGGSKGGKGHRGLLDSVDVGLSPWGRIQLVQTRVLRLSVTLNSCLGTGITGGNMNLAFNALSLAKTGTVGGAAGAASSTVERGNGTVIMSRTKAADKGKDHEYTAITPQSTNVLATLPGDGSSLLVSAPKGKVCKLVRFGESTGYGALERPYMGDNIPVTVLSQGRRRVDDDSEIDEEKNGGSMHKFTNKRGYVDYYADATSIAVRSHSAGPVRSSGAAGGNDHDADAAESKSEAKDSAKDSDVGDDEDGNMDDNFGEKHKIEDEFADAAFSMKHNKSKDGDTNERKSQSPSKSRDAKGESPSTKGSTGARDSYVNGIDHNAPLVLVGRSDGSLDLYLLDENADLPLQSWVLSNYSAAERNGSGSGGGAVSSSVVLVKWYPRRGSAFVAVDAAGYTYFFDLLADPYAPIHVCKGDGDAGKGALHSATTDLSLTRPGGRSAYLACTYGTQAGGGNITVRKFNDAATRLRAPAISTAMSIPAPGSGSYSVEETMLRSTMLSWAARIGQRRVVGVVSDTSANGKNGHK